ncbi:MAG: GNAT family N-acetyltransferase [Oscillospiraceae bacterium]|nr:GNAT family N-acetyltransferase [Oscillospiraceae bacterium]
MVIRAAVSEDLANIAELYVSNHRSTYQGLLSDDYLDALTVSYALEKWEQQLNSADSKILVACQDDSFLGFAAFMPDPDLKQTWYLESLQVAEKARGKGIGTVLIHAGAQIAEQAGFHKMSVCIVRGNNHAADLYKKLGAVHYSFFEDDFCGTVSSSEKLVWHKLPTEQ